MIKFWIEKRNLSWLRLAGILVVISFLFSSLSAPFVEASFWQERREAVENLKDSQTINSSTTEPIQLASAIGLTPFQTNALFPLSQSQIPASTINQVLEKVKQRSHANATIHTKHKFQEIPRELVNRLEPYGKIERVNIAKGQELRLKAGEISVGVAGKKESAEAMVSDISSLPLVIHIQDAHDIYSAQKNITLMINELTGLGAGIVGVEGAEGKIEGIERWGRYSGRESVMGVAGYLLKEGLLTGVEAAGLSQRLRERESSLIKRVEFYGVEDQKKYQEQVKAFKETLKSNEEVERWVKEAGEAITKLKETIYSDELRTLDTKKERYENGEIKLGEWVSNLWEAGDQSQNKNASQQTYNHQFSDPNSQSVNYSLQYPNLYKYIKAYEIEKKIVFKQVEQEQKKLLEGLSNRLNKQELMELLEESLAYRLGSIGYGEFYGYLRRRCEKAGIVITPEMKSYIEYLLLVEGIVQEKLFKELKELEEEVWNKSLWISGLGSGERSKNLTRSGILNSDHDQRNLYEIVNDYRLLVKAIAFKLSVEDWEEYTKRVEELETIGERINRLDATGNGVSALTLELKKVLRNVERFNELSHERNQIFVDKLVARMGERETHSLANLISSRQVKTRHGKADNNISILVSGGYHTKGIEELLRKKGISFITVRPNLNGDDIQKDYHPLYSFKRDLLPLEKMFLPEKVTLAPELAAVNVNSIKGQTAQGILRAAPVVLAELEGKGNLKALLKKEKWIKQGKVFTGVVDGVRVAVSKDEKIESLKQELEEAGFDSEEFEYATENPIIEDLDSRRKKRAFAIKKEIPSFLARAATLIRTNSARERAGKIVKFTRRNSVRIYTASGEFVEQKITNPIFAVLDTDANDGTTGGGDNKGLGVASNEISPMQTTVNPSSVVKKRSLLLLVLHAPLFILGAMGMGGGLGAGSVNGGGGKIQKRFIKKVFDLLVAIEEYQKLIAKGEGEAFQDWEEFLQLELPNNQAKDEFFDLANSIQISEATTPAIVEHLCRYVQDNFEEFHGASVKMNKFKGELDQMRRVRRKDQERIALQADRVQVRADQSPRLAELMRAGGMKPADVQFLHAAVPHGLMSLAKLLGIYYTVLTAEGAVLSFVRNYPPAIGASTGFVGPEAESLVMKYYDALVKVLEFADKMDRDPNARRFADLMAKISADLSYRTQMSGGWGNQPLPHSPSESKLYLELAPGTKFIFHMKTEIREGMSYHLVDTNYFVVAHLKKLAELFGKRKVEIIQKSVLDLDYPDGSIGTIHGNNFANFMNPTADWWKKACGWLEEGGQIIFTGDPKDISREKHAVMIRKLYYELVEKEGWSFDYNIGEARDNDVSKNILDLFVFTKPPQGTRLQTIHTLSDYLNDMTPRVSKTSQRIFLRELYISQRRSVPLAAVGKVLWMFEMHIPQAKLEVVKAIESLRGRYQDVIVVLERGSASMFELRRILPRIANQIKEVSDLDDPKIRNNLNSFFQEEISGNRYSHGEDEEDSDDRAIKKNPIVRYLYKHPEILAVYEEYPLEGAFCVLRGYIFLEKALHALYIEGNRDKYFEYIEMHIKEEARSLQLRDEALSKKIQDLMNQNPRSLIVVRRGLAHLDIVDQIGEYGDFEKEVRLIASVERREPIIVSLMQDFNDSLNSGQKLSETSIRDVMAYMPDLSVHSFFGRLLMDDSISYESFLELYAPFENVSEVDLVGLAALIHQNRALFLQNKSSITKEEAYGMLINPLLAKFELGWLHYKGYLSQELIAKLPDDVQQGVYEFSSMLANSPQQRTVSSEPEFKSADAKGSLIAGTISFAVGVTAVLAHSWILQKFGPLPNLIIFVLAAVPLFINKRRSTKHYRWLTVSLEAIFKSVFVVPSIAGFILMTDQGIKIRHALTRANKVRDGPEVPSKEKLNRLKRSLEELFKEEGTRIVLKDLEDEEKVKGKSVHEIAYVNQDNPEEIKARKIHVDLLAFYYLPDYLRETILRDHEISHLNGSNEIAAYLNQILRSWSNLKKYSKQTKFWRFLTVAGTIFIFLVTLFAVSIYNKITNPFSSPQNLPSLMQPSNVKKAADNIKATKISIDQWITNVMVNTDKNLLIFGEDHTSHRDRALFRSKILPHLKEMGVGLLVIEYVSVDHQPLLDSFNQTGVLPQAIKELSELTSQAAGLPKDEAVQLLHDIHAQGINLVASGSPLRSILRLINLRGHGSKEWFFQEQRDLITDQVLRYRQLYPAEKIVVYGGLLHNDRVPGEVASFLEPAFTVDFLDPLVFRPESFKYDSKTSKSWRFQYEMGVVMGANIAFGLGGDFAAQMSYSELADWILYLGESPTALNPLPVSTPFPTPTPIARLVPQVYPTGLAPQASPKSPISTNAPAQRIVWFFERHSQESSSKLVNKIEDDLLNKHKEIYLFLEQAAPMLGDINSYFLRRGILLDSERSLNDPQVISALETYLKERVWTALPQIIADFRSLRQGKILSDPNDPRLPLFLYLAGNPQIQILSEQPPIEAFLAQLRSDFALDRALVALYEQGDEKKFFKEMSTHYQQAFLSKKFRDDAIAKILENQITQHPHAAILVNIGSGHANLTKMVSVGAGVKTEKFFPIIDNQEPYDIVSERYGKAILSGRQIPAKARKLFLASLPLSVLIKSIPSRDLTDLKQATDIVLHKMTEKDLAQLAKDIRANASLLKRAGGYPFVWNNFTSVFILLWLREHDFLPVELQNKLHPAYRDIVSETKSLQDFLKALKIKYQQSSKENDLEKGMVDKEQALTANISGNSMLSGLKGLGLSLLPLVLTGAWSPDSTIVYLILSIAGLFAAGLLNFVLFSEKKRLSLSPFSKIVMRGVIVLLTVNGLQAVFNIKELNGYIFAGFLGLAFLMDRYIKYRLEFNSGIARVKNLMNKGSFWKALNAAEELAPKAKSLKDYYMLSKFFSEIGVKLNIERNRDFSLQAFENAIRMAKRVMELKFPNKSRSFFADVKFQSTKDGHLKYENSFEFLVRDLTKSARVDLLFEEAKKEHPDYQYEAYLLIWQELYKNTGQFALEEMAFHEAIAAAETTNVSNPYLLILETLWRETNGSLNAVFNFVSSSLDPALVSIRFGEAFYRLGEEEKDKKYFQELAKLSFEKAEGFIELAQDPLVQSRYYDLLAATLVNLYSIEETYRIMTKKGTTKVSIGVFDSSILQLAEKIALKRSPDYLQKVHQGEIEEDQKVPLYEEAGQMVSKRLISAQKIVSGYRKSLLRMLTQGMITPSASLGLSGLGLYAFSFSLKAASGSTTDLSFWLAIGGGLLLAGLIGWGVIHLWMRKNFSADRESETDSYGSKDRSSSFSRRLLIAGVILIIGLAGTAGAAPFLIREIKQMVHPTQGQLIYSFEFHALDTKDPFVQKIKEAAKTHDQVFIVLEQAPPGFNDLAPYLQQFPNAARMLTNLQLLDDPEMQESLEKLSSGFKPKSTDLLYQEWKAGKKQTYAPHLAPVFDYAFRNRGKVHLVAEKSPFESFKAQLKFEIFDQRVRFALYLNSNEDLAFDSMNNFYLQTALHVKSRDQALSLILQQLMKDHPYDAIFVRRGLAHDGIIEITGQDPKFQIQNITSINPAQFRGIPMVPALEKYSKELLDGGIIPRTERRLLLSYVPYQALHANFSNPYGVSIETLKRISTIFEHMTLEDLERLTRDVQQAYQTINARRYGYGYKRPGKELDLFIIAWLKENKFFPLEIENQLKPEIRALPISTLDGLINYLNQYGANLDKDLKTNLASSPQKMDIESVSAEVPESNSLLNKYALAFFAVSPFFTMGMAGVPMSVVVLLSSIKDTASHMVALVTSLNPWAVGGIIWAVIAVVFLWDTFRIIKKTGSDVGAYGDSHLEGAIVMIMVVGAFIGFVVWNMVGRPYEWFVFLSFITINVAIIIAIVIDQYFKKINGYYTHGWTEISTIDKKGIKKIIYRKPVKTAQIARERLISISTRSDLFSSIKKFFGLMVISTLPLLLGMGGVSSGGDVSASDEDLVNQAKEFSLQIKERFFTGDTLPTGLVQYILEFHSEEENNQIIARLIELAEKGYEEIIYVFEQAPPPIDQLKLYKDDFGAILSNPDYLNDPLFQAKLDAFLKEKWRAVPTSIIDDLRKGRISDDNLKRMAGDRGALITYLAKNPNIKIVVERAPLETVLALLRSDEALLSAHRALYEQDNTAEFIREMHRYADEFWRSSRGRNPALAELIKELKDAHPRAAIVVPIGAAHAPVIDLVGSDEKFKTEVNSPQEKISGTYSGRFLKIYNELDPYLGNEEAIPSALRKYLLSQPLYELFYKAFFYAGQHMTRETIEQLNEMFERMDENETVVEQLTQDIFKHSRLLRYDGGWSDNAVPSISLWFIEKGILPPELLNKLHPDFKKLFEVYKSFEAYMAMLYRYYPHKSSPNSKDSSSIERVVKDQDGQSMTEYGIMAGGLAVLYVLVSKLTVGVPGMGELILATLLLLGGVGFIIYGAILPIFKQMADQRDSGKLKEMEKLEERFNRVKGYLNADETVKVEKELKEIEKLKRSYLSQARVALSGSRKGEGIGNKGADFGVRRDKRNRKALNLLAMGVALALVTNPSAAQSKVVEDHLRSVVKNELSVNLPVEPILSSTVGEHSQELWDEGNVDLSDKIEMNQEEIVEFEETAWKVAVLAKWASSKVEYKGTSSLSNIGDDLPGATKTFDGTALFSNGVSKQIVEGSILNELRRGGEEKIALTSAYGVSKGKMEGAVERLIEKEIDKSLVQSAKDRIVYLSSSSGKRVQISSVISQLKSLGLGELGIQIITDDPLRLEESLQFNIRVKIYKLVSESLVMEYKSLRDVAEEMKEFRFIDINA